MRHGMANRKLGRTSSHRKAMFRNQLASLINNERIITTLPKAKELRPLAEKLVTLGKNDSVHSRRQAASVISDDTLVKKLFDTLGPRFSERPGGYTRIVKLGARRGDAAEMAILEFIGYELATETAAPTPKAEPKAKKSAPAKAEGDEAPKKRATKKAASDDKKAEAKPGKKAEAKPKRTRTKKAE